MMGCGTGVAKIGNAGARDDSDPMTIEAVARVQDSTFGDHGLRGAHMDRGRRWSLIPERGNFEFRCGTERESKYAAEARFHHAAAGDVVESGGAAPANHESYVLHSVEQIGDRGSHDAGAGVELPKFLAVGCAVGAEHSVGPALEDQIARSREHSAAFYLG